MFRDLWPEHRGSLNRNQDTEALPNVRQAVCRGRRLRDRNGLEILPDAECWELLAGERMGRVAMVDSGTPVVLPVLYGVHYRTIVFRSTPGAKLSAALAGARVAFEIDGHDFVDHSGWSVLVKGHAALVTGEKAARDLEHVPVAWWRHAQADWIRIDPVEVTGRRIDARLST
ncbi:MAG: pyridoxamine 5'-phosphate oxidase family protein [Actinobacteria bacterium ATB1]|nr:pyridoxamine 5'-phosphate oxidase family protein [Actinobacteria bacterium ATB1]